MCFYVRDCEPTELILHWYPRSAINLFLAENRSAHWVFNFRDSFFWQTSRLKKKTYRKSEKKLFSLLVRVFSPKLYTFCNKFLHIFILIFSISFRLSFLVFHSLIISVCSLALSLVLTSSPHRSQHSLSLSLCLSVWSLFICLQSYTKTPNIYTFLYKQYFSVCSVRSTNSLYIIFRMREM